MATHSADEAVLSRQIETLPGVGASRAKGFKHLGVRTLGELLEYFPRTYQFESSELAISQLVTDQIQTVRGEVVAVDYVSSRPRPRFEATLSDGTGKLSLTWFHSAYLRQKIHPGIHLRVQGKVKYFKNIPQMVNPHFEPVDESTEVITRSKFRPIYSATARLPTEAIESVIEENLPAALGEVHEWFDDRLLHKRGLSARRDAYRAIHQPVDLREAMTARRRIIFD